MLKSFFLLAGVCILFSCKQSTDVFYAEEVPLVELSNSSFKTSRYVTEEVPINIQVEANGNFPGMNDPAFIKNISGVNYAYCHPEVQFFPQGFNGYKYWMVFTPYFGSVGTEQVSNVLKTQPSLFRMTVSIGLPLRESKTPLQLLRVK